VSDTPETDAAFHKGMNCKEVFEFCRKLECERDRARALADEFHKDQTRLLMERDAWQGRRSSPLSKHSKSSKPNDLPDM
jgi:hypothetical protein